MDNKTPLISIVLPVYNGEKYIKHAIDSILNQTFKEFELIVVDDASTDSTPEILKEYIHKDKRIIVIRNEKNLYIARSLNKGIGLSRSNIIARMDADDVSFPSRLEMQYKLISDDPEVGVVGADIQIIDENDRVLTYRSYKTNPGSLKRTMMRYSPFAHPVVMFRKSYASEFGLYDHRYSPSEDVDLWFKMGSKYKFSSVPYPLLKYRVFMNSTSNRKLRRVEMLTLKMRINAVRNLGYTYGISDVIYNILQLATGYIMPPSFRVDLFNFLRNRGLI